MVNVPVPVHVHVHVHVPVHVHEPGNVNVNGGRCRREDSPESDTFRRVGAGKARGEFGIREGV